MTTFGVLISVGTFFIVLLPSSDGNPRVIRSHGIPNDWRNLLTDEVYNYHLNKRHGGGSSHFESDIAGIDSSPTSPSDGRLRNAILDKDMRWPAGIVPYEISAAFAPNEKTIIEEALEDLTRKTCVRFVHHAQQPDYISFVRRGLGCSSYVARIGGKQLVDLQPGCIYQIGEVQHEVMHALGFFHEQSRMDRDEYVTIVTSNIQEGAEDQFNKYRSDNQNMPYDYDSIMHYGWNYFAKDATKPTILPKVKAALGSRKIVSRLDVEKINRLYECPQRTATNSPAVVTARSVSARPMAHRQTTTTTTTTTTESPVDNGEQDRDGHGHHHGRGRHHHHRHRTHAPGHSLWGDFKDFIRGTHNNNNDK